ncbi:MAG TPA: prepilin-type N-terminal cleavage/methylation domain-containing protein [Candidatus Ozemobacteraceae bacterium]|nr:prepilin-type N-terminal cleavage/methylation domain-containing protein [Candidatus Ozemobacteraceae bacterium]
MKRGFTLIELLVVITILAVLAGAALPYVQSYVEESRLAKAKTDLEEIARAIMVYETREGDYNASDVLLLTGRYLNKSPIDPWGKAYAVSTESGTVYSSGSDRDYNTSEDNIFYPYQPPLALVQVKWVDKNNSGAVDTQNVNDELHLLFSRKLSCTAGAIQGAIDTCFSITTGTTKISAAVESAPGDVRMVASRTVILMVKEGTKDTFLVGSHSIQVLDGHNILKDYAKPDANSCISSQPVIILPQ